MSLYLFTLSFLIEPRSDPFYFNDILQVIPVRIHTRKGLIHFYSLIYNSGKCSCAGINIGEQYKLK
ncbi:hypothetical protein BWGOE4_25520 [Bacillus mycoides]|uniref:Uncharacterized protein n=1 Tax=Bacillus mycoides TaxID=1405 RepID=A0A1E8BN27_BACMY|nr:hypothetical protein IEM_00209 [Bacillus cereus BAG6O-2]OFD46946.1 hypothetical protein BWGOE3_25900 [Bacillus mycoides]OFD58973.1 hypothetical protein BWGOE4_25520 [Bacillus mycoides]OFD59852.1 hypothetical protein BWGOE6_25580 [Bacillus mycoides]OFD65969.1 hypothetical protein BWGOE7_24880 [Bacillus mycoides]